MKIPNTDITLEELLDQLPIKLQFVDKDGFLRYLNKADSIHPAKDKGEVGINLIACHARPESLERIEHIFNDFRQGRREPHYFITPDGNKSMKVPIFDDRGEFIGIFSFSHPVGVPAEEKTF